MKHTPCQCKQCKTNRDWHLRVQKCNKGKRWKPQKSMFWRSNECTPASLVCGALHNRINDEIAKPLWYLFYHVKDVEGYEHQRVLARRYANEWAHWPRGAYRRGLRKGCSKWNWAEAHRMATFLAKVINEFENLC